MNIDIDNRDREIYVFVFLSLNALDRNSSTTFNINGESRHIVPDLKGNAFSLSILSVLLGMRFFVGALYQVGELFLVC